MSDAAHLRRVRYKGTHPRSFHEKYKELAPELYAAEQEKVRARGHTPAGTHRPILVAEILERLAPRPGERFLDATLGWGGHSQALLERLGPDGHLLALDVDPLELPRTVARLRALGYGEAQFEARRMNFAGLPALRAETGPFDGILADLGLSSMQIDNPVRGFTFKADGPLDLRLNPLRGRPASELLAALDAPALADLLREHADEPFAEAIAEALKGAASPIATTGAFAAAVRAVMGEASYTRDDPETRKALQRSLQALRISVNDEYRVLEQFLATLPSALTQGGRVAILSFHSGEDRRVKKAFQEGLRLGLYAAVSDGPERPGPAERRANPRSAPARLRWAVRA